MLGRRRATTAIQTEMPKVSRIIHNLRRRARSKYSRICVLIPASLEAENAGCSFKGIPPDGGYSVNKLPTPIPMQAIFQRLYEERGWSSNIKCCVFIYLQ